MRSYFALCLVCLTTTAHSATLSNIVLPKDQYGEQLITGEASAMVHEGAYYFYFNNWGTCPGVDCCSTSAGCASCCFNDYKNYTPGCADLKNGSDPYGVYHTVQGYKTTDFKTWENMGVALPMTSRQPGTEFRPCVVYNTKTKLFVMWFENRGSGLSGYQVATAKTPAGPFIPANSNVGMPGKGRIGDFNIFVDDDATAYHVRTGFDIVKLDENYTAAAEHVASFSAGGEGPTFFKRNGYYYITTGSGCCACIGGSNVLVHASKAMAGPWISLGDVGTNPNATGDKHSPNNYVTRAQGSAVFKVGDQVIYLGNQWNSGLKLSPPGPRNHDLLSFFKLDFVPAPAPTSPPTPMGPNLCHDEIQEHKGGKAVALACAGGKGTIDKVVFAAFGTPAGSCKDISTATHGACDSANATEIIEAACIGKARCTIAPSTTLFGDPCLGTVKRLLVDVHCASTGSGGGSSSPLPDATAGGPDYVAQLVWQDTVEIDL